MPMPVFDVDVNPVMR